ncbi:hypothetical protein MCT03_18375 [Vibrio aestuarianus]|nr:hypothetical protein [Vibrio aestuarianus]
MAQSKLLDFSELIKIEASIISFLYVVLGFTVTAISGQNRLLFDLANGGAPNHFIPYSPFFSHIVTFTVINMIWVAFAMIGIFHDRIKVPYDRLLAYANGVAFLCAMGYFAYIAASLTDMFKFFA